jgi:hypothetical protein
METEQGSQLALFGNFSYKAQDEVIYAIEVAHAAGMAAAFGATADKRRGTVKITLDTELDDVTLRLVQNLTGEGWTRTDNGAAWTVILPPDLFERDAYTSALAYAQAFKETLRMKMHPYQFLFKLESSYTV